MTEGFGESKPRSLPVNEPDLVAEPDLLGLVTDGPLRGLIRLRDGLLLLRGLLLLGGLLLFGRGILHGVGGLHGLGGGEIFVEDFEVLADFLSFGFDDLLDVLGHFTGGLCLYSVEKR